MMRVDGQSVSVGIALGAGASHGWAHIGVLRALTGAGITPDLVVGCSAGALVGAYYAARRLDVLERWARAQTVRDTMTHLRLRPGHTLFGSSLFREMTTHFRGVMIEHLPIAFGAVTTNLEEGTRKMVTEGGLSRAVAASGAFPVLFPPVKIDGAWHVDGCLTDPVPTQLCRAMGMDIVIGVKVLGTSAAIEMYGSADDEAGQWREVLIDGKVPSTRPAPRWRAARLLAEGLRRMGLAQAGRQIRAGAAAQARTGAGGRPRPGLAVIAARTFAIHRRAALEAVRPARDADIVINPRLGPLRFGPEATARTIEEGRRAGRAQIEAVRYQGRAVVRARTRTGTALQGLGPILAASC